MAKIDVKSFLGKAKEYDIGGQMVSLEPLKGKDLDLFLDIGESKDSSGVKALVCRVLELTSDEFDSLPMNVVNDATTAIMDVNGLKKPE